MDHEDEEEWWGEVVGLRTTSDSELNHTFAEEDHDHLRQDETRDSFSKVPCSRKLRWPWTGVWPQSMPAAVGNTVYSCKRASL